MLRHQPGLPHSLGGVIVLAGGKSSRLGGLHKPALPLAGQSLLGHLLTALDGLPTIIVGLSDGISDEQIARVTLAREDPPGGGPVAAIAAGARHLAPDTELVAIVAADMPFLTRGHFDRLVGVLGDHDVAVPVARDRQQWLASVWKVAALRRALIVIGDPLNQSVRNLAALLDVRFLGITDADELRQLLDIDTPDDLNNARRMSDDG
ncbi:molybdopterin-guanine dinucleotide biosynthesis protein A [Antricoccus suffuscus]|uniref:Molybdopterin-guanine dinucleotide biosynthesis protein A n=1 Tax=Antricoccus suffuscus TaxID=1629062 RepID=A0A2T0Z1E4_9ACTN|nr:molybdenum cofactor guanylyltransferase [Antricoccus suffuscus]PRZ30171.1 molybdopterin-guanine dinucleotide biosynthesis protein A [Antricoccus suffuscus]